MTAPYLRRRAGAAASLALLAGASASAQFDLQLPLQYGWHQTVANPAALQDHTITVGLPSAAFGFRTPFTVTDLGEVRDGTLYVDAEQAVNRLDVGGNDQRFAGAVESLAFNYRGRTWQVGASHRGRALGHLDLPKGLVQVAAYGNARYVGQTLEVMPVVNLQAFEEYAVHGALMLKGNLTVGARAKFLRGTAASRTTTARAELYTAPDTYATSLVTDITVHTAGAPVEFGRSGVEVGDVGGIGAAGTGVGFDLGLVYRHRDHLELGLSLRDFGAVVWSDGTRHRSNGSFDFRGYEGSLFADGGRVELDVAGTLDSLLADVEFVDAEESFRTSLPATIQGTARYALAKNTTAQATVFAADADGVWHGGLGIGLGQRFGEWVHVGALAGMNRGGGYLGANLLVDVYGVQLYAACDNLVPLFDLSDADAAFVRAGANLAFGRVKPTRKVVGWYDLKVEGINK